jgi:phosphohistidine phosphatase SixA
MIRAALLALFLSATPVLAADFWDHMERPGTVAILRHAIAPGTGDPPGFRLGDCATQRNLDAAGRAQARAIGAAFRANGIAVNRVYASRWCRARETAELLGFGPVAELPALDSFFRDRDAAGTQTDALRAFLAALPETGKAVLVTHQVNITALTGRAVASGEVFALEVAADGRVTVLDSLLIRP